MATILSKDEDGGALTMVKGELTHKKLCECGREWLLAKRCNPVFVEKGCGTDEIPDVIGWDTENCWVIECKMSLADYRADKNKPHRFGEGLGNRRYYLVPSDLKDKIPNDTGWGLIVVSWTDYGVYGARQVNGRGSKEFERTLKKEVGYLRLRILGIQDYGR